MTAAGKLTCTGATINGEFTAGNTSSGYWIKLTDGGSFTGGYGNKNYGHVDFTAQDWDIDAQKTRYGVDILGDVIRLNSNRISVFRGTGTGTGTFGFTGNVKMPESIASDGTVTRWTNGSFINGIYVG